MRKSYHKTFEKIIWPLPYKKSVSKWRLMCFLLWSVVFVIVFLLILGTTIQHWRLDESSSFKILHLNIIKHWLISSHIYLLIWLYWTTKDNKDGKFQQWSIVWPYYVLNGTIRGTRWDQQRCHHLRWSMKCKGTNSNTPHKLTYTYVYAYAYMYSYMYAYSYAYVYAFASYGNAYAYTYTYPMSEPDRTNGSLPQWRQIALKETHPGCFNQHLVACKRRNTYLGVCLCLYV